MKYNPDIHKRNSIRLKGYDYSQEGLYFITICVKDRECLFGGIENGKMILNDAGKMLEKRFFELENKFPNIILDKFIIMPNHFHGIIEILNTNNVGADLCVCPDDRNNDNDGNYINDDKHSNNEDINLNPEGRHIGLPLQYDEFNKNENPILGQIIQWFKTMTTNDYIHGVNELNWQAFNKRLWQRNYYEHIIRDENSYYKIAEYIENNVLNWEQDRFYEK